ncbi:MAG: DNA-processing protein DprA [Nitrospirota bacterium]
MEYRVITPSDPNYPRKVKERFGNKTPERIYYNGPLEFLDRFTMAVISADSITGLAMMETNQILFTIREYDMNYIGGWHSVMETEIFRLGLFRKNTTVTLFSCKGLDIESYDSFLLDRFYPPLHEFPERDEYFRRAKDGELLMLSVSNPVETRQLRKNIMERNWIACVLSDVVFIPYGPKGSKTYTMAKKILETNIPAFTIDSEECKDLHEIGVSKFNRRTVRAFLEGKGAAVAIQENAVQRYGITSYNAPIAKEPTQTKISFEVSDIRKLKLKERGK